jgi:hypothetical protein
MKKYLILLAFGVIGALVVSVIINTASEPATETDDFQRLPVVKGVKFLCEPANPLIGVPSIVFTKQQNDGEVIWLADDVLVENLDIVGNVVSGEAGYWKSVDEKPFLVDTTVFIDYKFRFDFVQGHIEIFVPPTGSIIENPGIHVDAECTPYQVPLM